MVIFYADSSASLYKSGSGYPSPSTAQSGLKIKPVHQTGHQKFISMQKMQRSENLLPEYPAKYLVKNICTD